jgi:vacuolar protein sorting-associated protein 35
VQPAAESQANGEKTVEVGAAEDTPDSPATPTMEEKQVASYEEKPAPTVKKYRGIPEDVKLFEVFWHQVTQLVKVRRLCAL